MCILLIAPYLTLGHLTKCPKQHIFLYHLFFQSMIVAIHSQNCKPNFGFGPYQEWCQQRCGRFLIYSIIAPELACLENAQVAPKNREPYPWGGGCQWLTRTQELNYEANTPWESNSRLSLIAISLPYCLFLFI